MIINSSPESISKCRLRTEENQKRTLKDEGFPGDGQNGVGVTPKACTTASGRKPCCLEKRDTGETMKVCD